MSKHKDPVEGDENYTIEFFQGALYACREKLAVSERDHLEDFIQLNELRFDISKLNGERR